MCENIIFQLNKNKYFDKNWPNPSSITDFEKKIQKYIKEVPKFMVKLKCCNFLLCHCYTNNGEICYTLDFQMKPIFGSLSIRLC